MNHQEIRDEVSRINDDHWRLDYNDPCARGDHTLLRRLYRRVTPLIQAGMDAGLITSCECGPCGAFGFQFKP